MKRRPLSGGARTARKTRPRIRRRRRREEVDLARTARKTRPRRRRRADDGPTPFPVPPPAAAMSKARWGFNREEGRRWCSWVDWEDQILEDTVPVVRFVRLILHSGKYECGDKLSPDHERTILKRVVPIIQHMKAR